MTENVTLTQEELLFALKITSLLAIDDSHETETRVLEEIAHAFNADTAVLIKNKSYGNRSDGPVMIEGSQLSVRMTDEGILTGYLVLSRSAPPWSDPEGTFLFRIGVTVAPLLAARDRKRRELAGQKKRQTSLLLQERRLADLTENSPEMIYTTGLDDAITSINAAGVRLLGYDSPEELAGRRFSELALNPGDRESLRQRLIRNQRVADFEIILMTKDGKPIYCLESVSVMENHKGKSIGLQGIVKNISERIEMERDLWKSNLDLANLNQKLKLTQAMMVQQEKLASIGQLAAGVAHELNNPLAFLKSNFETTKQIILEFHQFLENTRIADKNLVNMDDAEAYFMNAFDDLTNIFRESEEGFRRIIRIVRDLKSFSRIDYEDTIVDIDLNNEFESTFAIAWNEIKYVAEIDTILGIIPKIKGHKGELGQVILNILMNAAQAIDSQHRPEKGRIEVHSFNIGKLVRLTIKDDGPGVPKEIQTKIFDPFFTTKEPGKGTGLGLSISYDIVVNRYGGNLSFVSEPGEGTIFTIELPIGTS